MKKTVKSFAVLLVAVMLLVPALRAFAAEEDCAPFADSRYYTVGDYSIHYRVWEAEEPLGRIFMIHGFALSTVCLEELARLLVEGGYTCVLADLPDFGYSSRETSETERLPREDIMHSLMTSLDDGPWFVAGHSMGGYVATAIAQKYPDSVRNLLLYGTCGNSGSPAASLAERPFAVKMLGGFMGVMSRCTPLVRLFLLLATLDIGFTAGYDIKKITDPFKIPGTGVGAVYSFTMLPVTDYEAVSKMPPILFVNGDRDLVITDSSRKQLRASLPAGSVDAVISGGGHLMIQTHARETADVTLDFLSCVNG